MLAKLSAAQATSPKTGLRDPDPENRELAGKYASR